MFSSLASFRPAPRPPARPARPRAPPAPSRPLPLPPRARYDDEDDDYVELDGESPAGAFSAAFSRALSAALRALDVVTDAAFAAAPPSMPRASVDAAVKLGALLLAAAFARSLLGIVITVGSVGLVAYVWSKANDGGSGARNAGASGRRAARRPGALPSGRASGPAGRGVDSSADLVDVWFDGQRPGRRREREAAGDDGGRRPPRPRRRPDEGGW